MSYWINLEIAYLFVFNIIRFFVYAYEIRFSLNNMLPVLYGVVFVI